MTYTFRVFNSVADIERAAWEEVCSLSGAPIFMDLRFVAAVEVAMKSSCRLWYVLIYEDGVRPVACAGMAAMKVDLTDFGDRRVTWIVKYGPRFLSRFRNMNMLFCSLPGSPGDRSIAVSPSAESPKVLALLDSLMVTFAIDAGLDAVVFKEFAPTDLEWMNPLLKLGYQRVEIPPMHLLDPSFESFSQYRDALRTHYRKQINRSVRKLQDSGIVSTILTDPEEILSMYTPDTHEMYCEMVRRSDLKIEVLPIEYYRQLVYNMNGQIELIALTKDSRIIAFGWCVWDDITYHMMYAGLDYRLNNEFDLYFNMVYLSFDRAFRRRVKRIHVGQTATAFKSRMGCVSEPRYIYTKGIGFFMSGLFHYCSNVLVIKKPSNPPANIFRRKP